MNIRYILLHDVSTEPSILALQPESPVRGKKPGLVLHGFFDTRLLAMVHYR